MREEYIVAIVAVVTVVALLTVPSSGPHGAFVGRAQLRIVGGEQPFEGARLCGDIEGRCVAPSCKTGLTRIAVLDGDIWRYQWITIPDTIGVQPIGDCCRPGVALDFRVKEFGETRPLRLSCDTGQWSGVFL